MAVLGQDPRRLRGRHAILPGNGNREVWLFDSHTPARRVPSTRAYFHRHRWDVEPLAGYQARRTSRPMPCWPAAAVDQPRLTLRLPASERCAAVSSRLPNRQRPAPGCRNFVFFRADVGRQPDVAVAVLSSMRSSTTRTVRSPDGVRVRPRRHSDESHDQGGGFVVQPGQGEVTQGEKGARIGA